MGWDEKHCKLRKSVTCNKEDLHCEEIDQEIEDKWYQAKSLLRELGSSLDHLDVRGLIELIKDKWDDNIKSEIKKKVENSISLWDWGNVLIERKKNANKPGTARWYLDGIVALEKFNKGKTIKLYEIALESGFTSIPMFYKFFNKIMRQKPSEYRGN